MMEVQLYHISNDSLYEDFGIDLLENIMVSRQLRWIGKIALMEETRLPLLRCVLFVCCTYRNVKGVVTSRVHTIKYKILFVSSSVGEFRKWRLGEYRRDSISPKIDTTDFIRKTN